MDPKEISRPIPDSEMPPTRPNWKYFLGAAVVVLAAVALLNEHLLVKMLGI